MLVNLGAQMSLRKKGLTAVPHKLMASIVNNLKCYKDCTENFNLI